MLAFLRKTRKSLVGTGSTRKYLIYALGEILLVMIGILLALQVNNWNESRKNHKIEHKYLIELKKDYQLNKDLYDFVIKTENLQRLNGERVLGFLTSDSIITEKELVFAIEISGYNMKLNPERTTWDDLISTGNTSIIKNEVLVSKMRKYYSQLKFFKENETVYDEYKSWYRKEVLGVLNPKNRFEANSLMGREWHSKKMIPDGNLLTKEIDYEDMVERLRSKTEIPGILSDVIMSRRVATSQLSNDLKIIENVLNDLNVELENRFK